MPVFTYTCKNCNRRLGTDRPDLQICIRCGGIYEKRDDTPRVKVSEARPS
jgi:rRNA maturation endonuclease Nob1